MIPWEKAYFPVKKLALLGEHKGVVAKAFLNKTAFVANLSMFGVWI
jgi:hypothetical protein